MNALDAHIVRVPLDQGAIDGLLDLLTPGEDANYQTRFDIGMRRPIGAVVSLGGRADMAGEHDLGEVQRLVDALTRRLILLKPTRQFMHRLGHMSTSGRARRRIEPAHRFW